MVCGIKDGRLTTWEKTSEKWTLTERDEYTARMRGRKMRADVQRMVVDL